MIYYKLYKLLHSCGTIHTCTHVLDLGMRTWRGHMWRARGPRARTSRTSGDCCTSGSTSRRARSPTWGCRRSRRSSPLHGWLPPRGTPHGLALVRLLSRSVFRFERHRPFQDRHRERILKRGEEGATRLRRTAPLPLQLLRLLLRRLPMPLLQLVLLRLLILTRQRLLHAPPRRPDPAPMRRWSWRWRGRRRGLSGPWDDRRACWSVTTQVRQVEPLSDQPHHAIDPFHLKARGLHWELQ